MPPFWNGKLTPDAFKALILQLDPDDDEAEQKIRQSLERRTERNLNRAFRDMMDTYYPQGWGGFEDPQIEAARIHRAFLEDERLRAVVSETLRDGADLGANIALQQMQNVGMSFDWTLAHAQGMEWAATYTDDLLAQLGTTSQRVVGQAASAWLDSGESLQVLVNQLEPLFGPVRAEMIAATEVTRAVSEGTIISYRQSGLIDRRPNEEIPKHPRCRCWWALQQNANGQWVYIFYSSADERVCPICGPLHGTEH